MNNLLTLIDERILLGKQFRIYGDYETPLFLAKDVAEWIEYGVKNSYRLLEAVDGCEKVKKSLPTIGGTQETWFFTEDGLYEVLMQSRKPIAKEFKKEVKEILKTIRTTGGYVSNADKLVETYFNELDNNHKTIVKGLFINIEEQQKRLTEQAPKVEYFDTFMDANQTFTAGQLAGKLGQVIGRPVSAQKLNNYLYALGFYDRRTSKRNKTVTKEFSDKGWHVYREYVSPSGYAENQVRFTVKGMKEVIEHVLNRAAELRVSNEQFAIG